MKLVYICKFVPAIALAILMVFALHAPLASAQIFSFDDPFLAEAAESWEGFPHWFTDPLPDISGSSILAGRGQIIKADFLSVYNTAEASLNLGSSGPASTFDGIQGLYAGGGATVEFSQPITDFGAFWGAFTDFSGAPPFDPGTISVKFYDQALNQIGLTQQFTYSRSLQADGLLEWHGWTSTVPIRRVTYSSSSYGVANDGMRINRVPDCVATFCASFNESPSLPAGWYVQTKPGSDYQWTVEPSDYLGHGNSLVGRRHFAAFGAEEDEEPDSQTRFDAYTPLFRFGDLLHAQLVFFSNWLLDFVDPEAVDDVFTIALVDSASQDPNVVYGLLEANLHTTSAPTTASLDELLQDPDFDTKKAYRLRLRVRDNNNSILRIEFDNLNVTGAVQFRDYDDSGGVDIADYILWRNTFGDSVTPGSGADGSYNGIVDQDDYDIWKANFGVTLNLSPATGISAAVVVPEPSRTALPIAIALGVLLQGRMIHRRS